MNEIKKEINSLVAALKNDAAYCYSWQANIAMSIVAQFAQKGLRGDFIHNTANDAAKDFLDLLTRIHTDEN